MTVSRAAPRRRRAVLAVAALAGSLAAISIAGATTGPNQVSIASTGGYVACLTGIANGDAYATYRSIQGTRHPYKGAAYDAADNVIGVSPQISNDSTYLIHEGGSNLKTQRVDNQAASAGNGLYECKAIP